MPYTIACHHHRTGHHDRHPQEWDRHDQAARELSAIVEELATGMSPQLSEVEKSSVRAIAAEAARTGVAVLPGLVSYQVLDVTDAPPHQGADTRPARPVDWAAVGRLARRAQQQTITLNHLAAVAPAPEPGFDAPGQARAAINELAELCAALHLHLATTP